MKISIFCHHVKDLDFLDNFMTTKDTKDNFITGTIRAIRLNKDPKLASNLIGRELIYLGSIDDTTGVIEATKETVIDFDNYFKVSEEVSLDDPKEN